MKFKLTSECTLSLVTCCYILFQQQVDSAESPATIIRRTADKQQVGIDDSNSNNQVGSLAMASVSNGPRQTLALPIGREVADIPSTATINGLDRNNKPSMSTNVKPDSVYFGDDRDQPRIQSTGPRRTSKADRLSRPRPPTLSANRDRYDREYDYNDYNQDDDCYDESNDFNYRNIFYMATNPMRRIGRMMDNVFDQMQASGLGYDEDNEYNNQPPIRSVASSSAFSNGGGFSRLSSSVTNNGRTRGIISETRNGRTKIKRIGGDVGDDDERRDRANSN